MSGVLWAIVGLALGASAALYLREPVIDPRDIELLNIANRYAWQCESERAQLREQIHMLLEVCHAP